MDEQADKGVVIELCKICLKKKSKYTCPKCNIEYCSVDCYKSSLHSECSELFYQEWVETELKSQKLDSAARQKMFDILKRHQNSECEDYSDSELDSDDVESLPDIKERLSGINLDDSEAVWDKLSSEEKIAFQEVLDSGCAQKLVPLWTPWWFENYEGPKVIDMDSPYTSDTNDDIPCVGCPLIRKNIPRLSELTKIAPAPTVTFNLFNVLGGYTIIMRHFNGDYTDFTELAAALLFNISKSLLKNLEFYSVDMALEAVVLQTGLYLPYFGLNENSEQMKEDLKMIIKGPCKQNNSLYIRAALSDIHNLFTIKPSKKETVGSFHSLFPENVSLDVKFISSKDRSICLKRLEYFLSFSLDLNINRLNL